MQALFAIALPNTLGPALTGTAKEIKDALEDWYYYCNNGSYPGELETLPVDEQDSFFNGYTRAFYDIVAELSMDKLTEYQQKAFLRGYQFAMGLVLDELKKLQGGEKPMTLKELTDTVEDWYCIVENSAFAKALDMLPEDKKVSFLSGYKTAFRDIIAKLTMNTLPENQQKVFLRGYATAMEIVLTELNMLR